MTRRKGVPSSDAGACPTPTNSSALQVMGRSRLRGGASNGTSSSPDLGNAEWEGVGEEDAGSRLDIGVGHRGFQTPRR